MVLQQEGSVLKPVVSPKGQTFKFWGLHLLLESIFISLLHQMSQFLKDILRTKESDCG